MKLQALRSRLNRIAPFPSETSMKTPFLLLAALGGLTTASAEIPNSLLFQGYLTQGNAPLTGEQTLLVKACDALTDGTCKTVFNGKVQAASGYYTALLENLPVMDKPYWLEVASNGTLLPARIALTASPYALRAASSQKADTASFAAKAGIAGKADSAGFAVKADTAKFASKAGTSLKADTAAVAVKALTSSKSDTAKFAFNSIISDSTVGALRSVISMYSLFADSAALAKTLTQNPTINGNLTTTGNTIAAGYKFATPKKYTFEISPLSFTINPSTSPNWQHLGYEFGAICPSNGGIIGKLKAIQIIDLPDGAVVDSMSIIAHDEVGYPVMIQLMYQTPGANAGWIISGDPNTYTSIMGTWTTTSYTNIYKKNYSGSSHIVNKRNYIYYFRILNDSPSSQATSTTCPTAAATPVGIIKASLVYHLSEL